MFAPASPSNDTLSAARVPAYLRATSAIRANFAKAGSETKLIGNFETGGLRLRMPRTGAGCDGVIVNTAGGLAGGDRCDLTFAAGPAASLRLTSQSAEKIYRSDTTPSEIALSLTLAHKAQVVWVPQETILFNDAALRRSVSVDMAADATLTFFEMTVFGRTARGERLTGGSLSDQWRIRRDGKLCFAENVRLDGDISEQLQPAATGGGASAIATLLYVAPKAEAKLKAARGVLGRAACEAAASAWNGVLVARFVARDAMHLRTAAAQLLTRLTRREVPRVWLV